MELHVSFKMLFVQWTNPKRLIVASQLQLSANSSAPPAWLSSHNARYKHRENRAVSLAPPTKSAQPHLLPAWRSSDVWSRPDCVSCATGGGSALGGSASCENRGWDDCRQAFPKVAASTLQFHGSGPIRGCTPFQGSARGARAPKALHRRQHW